MGPLHAFDARFWFVSDDSYGKDEELIKFNFNLSISFHVRIEKMLNFRFLVRLFLGL